MNGDGAVLTGGVTFHLPYGRAISDGGDIREIEL